MTNLFVMIADTTKCKLFGCEPNYLILKVITSIRTLFASTVSENRNGVEKSERS